MDGNPFIWLTRARRNVALLLAAALFALATVARAGPLERLAPTPTKPPAPIAEPAAPDDFGTLMTYAGCAVGIAIASTTAQVYFAVFGCMRIFIDEVDW
jgi:hypothetical protein